MQALEEACMVRLPCKHGLSTMQARSTDDACMAGCDRKRLQKKNTERPDADFYGLAANAARKVRFIPAL